MGSSQSKELGLLRYASPEHEKKVGPLLRANHKHQLLLTTTPRTVTRISQSLSAACLLDIQPVSALFDLWDKVAHDTIDVTDSEDEIVQVDFLSPSHLGHEEQATRYVDFFDDEVVRLLYSYKACIRHYLAIDQVVDGLMARKGWGIRQLSLAVELSSKDMCTEALGGALAFYVPLTHTTSERNVPQREQDVVQARNAVVQDVLSCKTSGIEVVEELVILQSICALWSFMPKEQFARVWTWQMARLGALPETTRVEAAAEEAEGAAADAIWAAIIRKVCECKPFNLPELRLLKDHSKYGLPVAHKLFDLS